MKLILNAFDLHARAQMAEMRDDYRRAHQLYLEAARYAQTENGAKVLREKAATALRRSQHPVKNAW